MCCCRGDGLLSLSFKERERDWMCCSRESPQMSCFGEDAHHDGLLEIVKGRAFHGVASRCNADSCRGAHAGRVFVAAHASRSQLQCEARSAVRGTQH